jgi:hypothetical protein
LRHPGGEECAICTTGALETVSPSARFFWSLAKPKVAVFLRLQDVLCHILSVPGGINLCQEELLVPSQNLATVAPKIRMPLRLCFVVSMR